MRWANLDLGNFLQKLLLEATLPNALGHIQPRKRRALLSLVLKRAPNTLQHGVPHFRALMDDMEVLSACLTNDAGVPFVLVKVHRDVLPELLEHEGGAGEVQSSEGGMVYGLCNDLRWWAGHELDHTRWDACFSEDLIDEVVGVGGHG